MEMMSEEKLKTPVFAIFDEFHLCKSQKNDFHNPQSFIQLPF